MPHPILITRAADKADQFAAQLRVELPQAHIVISPVLAMKTLAVDIPDFDIALFTSGQAIRVLPAGFDARDRAAICVGQKTTDAARDLGFDAHLGGQTVDDLVSALPDVPTQARYLHLRGKHTTGNLKDRMTALGHQVADCILYDQRRQTLSATAKAILLRETPVILPLFSPRSARLVIEQVTNYSAHVAVCISNNVANVCAQTNFCRIRVAQAPTAHDMVKATVIAASGG